MTDVRIATSAEQPINSDGAVSTVTGVEGDLVGLDANGELVAADAASGTQVPAIGVLATPVDDPANYPSGQFEYAAKTAEANRALINDDKVSYVRYGTEIENVDADWGFTPDEPVYLDVGGGYTQTKPTGVDELVQRVGVAIEAEVVHLDIEDGYERIDYNTTDVTASGDGTTTTFTFAHGLNSAPSTYNLQPTSSAAAADHYVSNVTASDIEVTFASAPGSGTDNITFNLYAEE